MMKKYILLTMAVLAFLAVAGIASACPTCLDHSAWKATPCVTYNCSPCGFCSYCCGRHGIGCQYCKPPKQDQVALADCADDAEGPLFTAITDQLLTEGTEPQAEKPATRDPESEPAVEETVPVEAVALQAVSD
jgi:hypothetical protein